MLGRKCYLQQGYNQIGKTDKRGKKGRYYCSLPSNPGLGPGWQKYGGKEALVSPMKSVSKAAEEKWDHLHLWSDCVSGMEGGCLLLRFCEAKAKIKASKRDNKKKMDQETVCWSYRACLWGFSLPVCVDTLISLKFASCFTTASQTTYCLVIHRNKPKTAHLRQLFTATCYHVGFVLILSFLLQH